MPFSISKKEKKQDKIVYDLSKTIGKQILKVQIRIIELMQAISSLPHGPT